MDEDMVVIIIGDNEGDSELPRPINIKTEPIDDVDVDKLLKVAEKHGQHISKKEEFAKIEVEEETYNEYEQNEDQDETYEGYYIKDNGKGETYEEYEKNESQEEGYEEYYELNEDNLEESDLVTVKKEYDSEDDQDYIQAKEECMDDDSDENYVPEDEYMSESDDDDWNKVPKHRTTMVPAEQRKSFVQDLKQEYPELRNDRKTLISVLSEIMRNIKRPEPPQDFYYVTDIMFECRWCGAMSESLQAAGRHYQERHGPRYLVCFACGVDFRCTTNLYKHEKRCTAPDIVTVLKARALFLGRKGRSRPFMPKPEDIIVRTPVCQKTFPCSECSAVFTSKINLEAHENLHKGLRPYRCRECLNAYTSEARLKRHCKQQHSGIQYYCDHCGRGFKIKTSLAVHMYKHAPQRRFGCDECDKRYATRAALKQHVRSAHRMLPPPCACPICPKRYPRMSLVRDHMKKTHGMSIVTRRMFFKALPTLTDEQLHQAKAIVKSGEESHSMFC